MRLKSTYILNNQSQLQTCLAAPMAHTQTHLHDVKQTDQVAKHFTLAICLV